MEESQEIDKINKRVTIFLVYITWLAQKGGTMSAYLRKKRRDLIYRLESMRRRVHDGTWIGYLRCELERKKQLLEGPEVIEGDHEWFRERIVELSREIADFEELPIKIALLQAELRRMTRSFKALGHARRAHIKKDLQDELLEERSSRKQRGWHDHYVPTRRRYWRSADNNWKRHRKTKYRV